MQIAIISWARDVCGLAGANSTEFDEKAQHPVIDFLPEQKKIKDKGATMRLGAQDIEIKEGTETFRIYGGKVARERFRHRYEVNPEYLEKLERDGLVFSGKAPGTNIMQLMELKGHPFYMGTQFHPEFKSRPTRPHPLFESFVKAAFEQSKK